MAIEDVWMKNLVGLVESLGQGDKRRGYREVAEIAGLSEEYVYQLVESKPNKDGEKRVVGKRAAKKIAIAFANGRALEWFDVDQFSAHAHTNPATSQGKTSQDNPTHDPSSAAELVHAIEKVETALEKIKAASPANTVHIEHAWPFDRLSREQWTQLTPEQKTLVESMALQLYSAASGSENLTDKRQATG